MCLFPVRAHLDPDGGRPRPNPEGEMHLPCGRCPECITLRAVDWATRARHEISCHSENCFLTLTYDDENLPSNFVDKSPFQNFLKRLRKNQKKKLSYIVSHEYGSTTYRPHHHAIIFGYCPEDQIFLRNSKSGEKLFTSPSLLKLWPHGHHSIGTANERSAFYIAAYALKGKKHDLVLPDGSIEQVADSFDCSKRPGIGLNFFKKNYKSIVHSGEQLPRYYRKKLEKIDPDYYLEIDSRNAMPKRQRDSHELLAKYVIEKAQKALSETEFRVDTTSKRDSYFDLKKLKEDAGYHYENQLITIKE